MEHEQLLEQARKQKVSLVTIGTSAGGVAALGKLLPSFKTPSSLTVMVVIHLTPKGPNLIPSIFKDRCSFDITEAQPGLKLQAETIYIAPPDYHLSVERNGCMTLSNEEPVNFSRPSIDVLFDSAAHTYQERTMGILLTGANHDGAWGLEQIQRYKGLVVVQEPSNAEVPVMPEMALLKVRPDLLASLEEISHFIERLSSREERIG